MNKQRTRGLQLLKPMKSVVIILSPNNPGGLQLLPKNYGLNEGGQGMFGALIWIVFMYHRLNSLQNMYYI